MTCGSEIKRRMILAVYTIKEIVTKDEENQAFFRP